MRWDRRELTRARARAGARPLVRLPSTVGHGRALASVGKRHDRRAVAALVVAALERKRVARGPPEALHGCLRDAVGRAATRTTVKRLAVAAAVRCCARDPRDARARREREAYCPVNPKSVHPLRRRRALCARYGHGGLLPGVH